MKRSFITLIAMLALTTAWADSYPYLTLQNNDGTVQSVAVDQLVLTFQDGQLVANNSEGTERFTLTDLSKMYFSQGDQTGIESTEWVQENLGDAEIFDLQGHKVSDMTRKGVYLVKQNGKTRKVLVR